MGQYAQFLTTPEFRKAFGKLTPDQQNAARKAAKVFKKKPFDPQLRAHKINKLSSRLKCTVYAVDILGNLRAVFYIEGSTVISFDIGTHDIYK